ncbi:MAG: hypothetical protein NTU90_03310, partial [Proteobacteria bacterium]|nr:hypothetical protein [Pseudomonadota bacterium]
MERVPKGVYTKEFKEEAVCIPYGLPLSYYVDSHSIFRFIERRDSFWIKHHVKTDERDPQWKQV